MIIKQDPVFGNQVEVLDGETVQQALDRQRTAMGLTVTDDTPERYKLVIDSSPLYTTEQLTGFIQQGVQGVRKPGSAEVISPVDYLSTYYPDFVNRAI